MYNHWAHSTGVIPRSRFVDTSPKSSAFPVLPPTPAPPPTQSRRAARSGLRHSNPAGLAAGWLPYTPAAYRSSTSPTDQRDHSPVPGGGGGAGELGDKAAPGSSRDGAQAQSVRCGHGGSSLFLEEGSMPRPAATGSQSSRGPEKRHELHVGEVDNLSGNTTWVDRGSMLLRPEHLAQQPQGRQLLDDELQNVQLQHEEDHRAPSHRRIDISYHQPRAVLSASGVGIAGAHHRNLHNSSDVYGYSDPYSTGGPASAPLLYWLATTSAGARGLQGVHGVPPGGALGPLAGVSPFDHGYGASAFPTPAFAAACSSASHQNVLSYPDVNNYNAETYLGSGAIEGAEDWTAGLAYTQHLQECNYTSANGLGGAFYNNRAAEQVTQPLDLDTARHPDQHGSGKAPLGPTFSGTTTARRHYFDSVRPSSSIPTTTYNTTNQKQKSYTNAASMADGMNINASYAVSVGHANSMDVNAHSETTL
ncbi:unnamed protein product [Amoebophrya sp. A25]|nr:unnamed protein product [Amoebophrya sp. A25]|eukprot:GSA25T00011780001.1